VPKKDPIRRDFFVHAFREEDLPPSIRVQFIVRDTDVDAPLEPRPIEFVLLIEAKQKGFQTTWQIPPPTKYQNKLKMFEEEAERLLTLRISWLEILRDLVGLVESTAIELGWRTKRIPKEIKDSDIGDYEASSLLMQYEIVRILLEPIGRSGSDLEGVADLYMLPAYDDVVSLYYNGNKWHIHQVTSREGTATSGTTSTSVSWPLSKADLRRVLEEMKNNAG